MRPPVRTVCTRCLQSLEIASGEESEAPVICPFCGVHIDPSKIDLEANTQTGPTRPRHGKDTDPTTPEDPLSLHHSPGRINRFEILEPLGEGGYGQVYRAYDTHLDRHVALKVLKANRLGEKSLERFYREARAAARLDHPNIVGLHDAGCDAGQCWIAYQLVSGRTLSMIRDLERPKIEESIRIVRDLALALDHAHGRGVYHRDLKPANVLVDSTGRARLTDFGLARRDDIDSDLTREGTVLGTPQYMSPEAADGRSHLADARSDVYSLGVILYELICGRRPAQLPSNAPLWKAHRITTPPIPSQVDSSIPASLDRICLKALALDPGDRYPSAAALASALTDCLPRRQDEAPKPRRRPGTRSTVVGLSLAASVLGVVLGMGIVSRTGAPDVPRGSVAAPLVEHPEPPVPVEKLAARDEQAPSTPRRAVAATSGESSPRDLMEEQAVRTRSSSERIFHLRTCQHTKDKDQAKLQKLGTVREAYAAGYKACRACLGSLPPRIDEAGEAR